MCKGKALKGFEQESEWHEQMCALRKPFWLFEEWWKGARMEKPVKIRQCLDSDSDDEEKWIQSLFLKKKNQYDLVSDYILWCKGEKYQGWFLIFAQKS